MIDREKFALMDSSRLGFVMALRRYPWELQRAFAHQFLFDWLDSQTLGGESEKLIRELLKIMAGKAPGVDWSTLSPEECVRSAKAAPIVAYPWEDCNSCGGVKMYADGMWKRRRAWPQPDWMSVAYVQPETPGPGWSFSLDGDLGRGSGYATAEEAMRAADELLTSKGVRLIHGSGGVDTLL